MERPLTQRLSRLSASLSARLAAALLAFALALLVPSLARATLVPACESHQLTRMPVEWLLDRDGDHDRREPAPDACSSVERVERVTERGDRAEDELTDSRVAAMCDGRGASMVAPPLVRAIVDARIDAPACSLDLADAAPVARPGREHTPLGAPAFALAQHAVLDAETVVAPPCSELAPPYPAIPGEARAGVRLRIDHPPR